MKTLCFMAAVFAGLIAAQVNVPLLTDGTVNFGAASGDDGVWELSYIESIGDYVTSLGGSSVRLSEISHRSSATEPLVPFTPWAAALYDYNVHTMAKYDPEGYCIPPGGPRLFTTPYPMKIIQAPDQKRVFFLFEAHHVFREVFMDGRAHPQGKTGTALGHSVGHYEDGGKTLVIDVTGFNEQTWLDFAGHPHTDQLHVTERFTRPAKNQLRYEALIDDPGAYEHPWTVSWTMKWWVGGELDEYICEENNKYIHTLKDDFGNGVFFSR
jgi:hypothetical protein